MTRAQETSTPLATSTTMGVTENWELLEASRLRRDPYPCIGSAGTEQGAQTDIKDPAEGKGHSASSGPVTRA